MAPEMHTLKHPAAIYHHALRLPWRIYHSQSAEENELVHVKKAQQIYKLMQLAKEILKYVDMLLYGRKINVH